MRFLAENADAIGITKEELVYRLQTRLCVECAEPFSNKNVHTSEGWAETHISGMCEDCFNNLFKEIENESCKDDLVGKG